MRPTFPIFGYRHGAPLVDLSVYLIPILGQIYVTNTRGSR